MSYKILFYILLFILFMTYYYILGKKNDNLKFRSEFVNNELIPVKYTSGGENSSPPLKISNISKKAESMAIIVEDENTADFFTHWLIWNISADINKIPAGIPSRPKVKKLGGAFQGENDFGSLGYTGPSPDKGTHTYRFKLFVLDKKLDIEPGVNKSQLESAMLGAILQKKIIRGKYEKDVKVGSNSSG